MLYELLPEQWRKALPDSEAILAQISIASPFVPNQESIFRAFNLPIARIKVVILGQDPYPNPDHATGLSFSVRRETSKLPPTLSNIFKELSSDRGITASSGDLTAWQDQGVFLLNRVLTTTPNVSQAHSNIGWQNFTSQVIEYLAKRPIVFILWGKSAGEVANLIPQNQLIQGVHPSPLSAYRGFFGSKPFTRANEKLNALGISEIDWRI